MISKRMSCKMRMNRDKRSRIEVEMFDGCENTNNMKSKKHRTTAAYFLHFLGYSRGSAILLQNHQRLRQRATRTT